MILQLVPIVCLVFFIVYIEFQLKREMHIIEQEFKNLRKIILNNKSDIKSNTERLDQHQDHISKLSKS